jgi:hypothetical protein
MQGSLTQVQTRGQKPVKCYACHQWGNIKPNCPNVSQANNVGPVTTESKTEGIDGLRKLFDLEDFPVKSSSRKCLP